MSVRKRTWKTSKGVEKEAWVVDYFDKVEGGKRHLKSFNKKKDAVNFAATARTEVRAGMHTADSQSVTVSEAGRLWITTGEKNRLERSTLTMYRQQLSLHIAPYLGDVKLSQLSAPMVREFEDKLARDRRSAAMVRKVHVASCRRRGLTPTLSRRGPIPPRPESLTARWESRIGSYPSMLEACREGDNLSADGELQIEHLPACICHSLHKYPSIPLAAARRENARRIASKAADVMEMRITA
jgi:hypothetical protein